MHSLISRNRAETWLHVNPKPTSAEVARFVTRHPQVLPMGKPVVQPTTSLAYRLALKALRVVAVLLVLLVMALVFVLFGEERPERVRPDLTDAQRTQAFRLPHH